VPREPVPPLLEEVPIDLSRPNGLLDLGEREPEDVMRGRQDPGVGQFLGLPQDAALRQVEELDDVELGVFAQADPGAVHGDAPSTPPPLEPPERRSLQSLEEPRRGPLGSPLAGQKCPAVLARGAGLHVTLDRRDELRRGLTPTRPREVDLAGTPHAIAFKERSDRLADLRPTRDSVEAREERRVVCPP